MIIKYEVKNPKIKDAIKNKLFPNKKWESLKKNPPPPIKLESGKESLMEKMEELEMQVQEEMNDMFEEGSLGTKKKILH